MIKAIEAIKEEKNIAIITHVNPDGDALGSSLGLMLALESMGKTVDVYCQDPVPKGLLFLEGAHKVKIPVEDTRRYDLTIALDCSDLERMGSSRPILDEAGIKVNIDHHKSNTLYGDINLVDGKAAATGELVFSLIDKMDGPLDGPIAEALYTAIVSDTGGFSFSNTGPKTHRIVASLIEGGVLVDKVHSRLFKDLSIGWVRLLGNAINTLRLYHDGRVATMEITQEMFTLSGATEDQTEGIIRYAKDITSVELAALFREVDPQNTKVSLRSGSMIDASELAQSFGGGGHIRAAGYTFHSPVQGAKEVFLEAVDKLFKEL